MPNRSMKDRINQITTSSRPSPKDHRIPEPTPEILGPLSMIRMLWMRGMVRVLACLRNGRRIDIVASLGVARIGVLGWHPAGLLL